MYKNFAKTVFIGKTINYLPSCHSTNSVAIEMLKAGRASNGHIVITDHQFSGKGQVGRSWEAKPGMNLTFSIILIHDSFPVKNQFDLNMVVSVGILDFLSKLIHLKIEIKWPNDIFCNERKVSGILVRNSVMGSMVTDTVVGIGLNVNQDQFTSPGAVSLKTLAQKEFDLQRLFEGLIQSIEDQYLRYMEEGRVNLKYHYLDNLYRRGEVHRFLIESSQREISGEIIGVDQIGRLSVNTGGRIENFTFNTIKFLGNV